MSLETRAGRGRNKCGHKCKLRSCEKQNQKYTKVLVREEHLVKRKLKFREMFDRLDVDGSGFLDKSELRKAVFFGDRELGSYINPKKFSAAFAAMDFNSNGEIPYEPFELFLMDCEDAASANLNFPDISSSPIPTNDKQPKMLGDTRLLRV